MGRLVRKGHGPLSYPLLLNQFTNALEVVTKAT